MPVFGYHNDCLHLADCVMHLVQFIFNAGCSGQLHEQRMGINNRDNKQVIPGRREIVNGESVVWFIVIQ